MILLLIIAVVVVCSARKTEGPPWEQLGTAKQELQLLYAFAWLAQLLHELPVAPVIQVPGAQEEARLVLKRQISTNFLPNLRGKLAKLQSGLEFPPFHWASLLHALSYPASRQRAV